MPRLPLSEKRKGLYVTLPESLFIEVKTLLLDPMSGRVSYGKMSAIVTQLLSEWIEKKRKGEPADEADPKARDDGFKVFEGE